MIVSYQLQQLMYYVVRLGSFPSRTFRGGLLVLSKRRRKRASGNMKKPSGVVFPTDSDSDVCLWFYWLEDEKTSKSVLITSEGCDTT